MKKIITFVFILLTISTLLLASCGQSAESEEESAMAVTGGGTTSGSMGYDGDYEKGISYEERDDSFSIVTSPSSAQAPPVINVDIGAPEPELYGTERMIVRTGNLQIVVTDVPEAIDNITNLAVNLDGYVVNSRMWKSGERLDGSISIRVPSEDYEDAMRALRNLAEEVTYETSYSEDVTQEYIDLSSRLSNLEATEQQLLVIMEKAETVEDTLDVQAQLSKTREDIEVTKGRMQYLEQTSSTSLIEISLQQSTLGVEFTASQTRIKVKQEVWFYSEIGGGFPPYTFEWDFGDGTTETGNNVPHVYKNDGKFTVTLTVTDDKGNSTTETRTDYITATPGWSIGTSAGNAWDGLAGFGRVLLDIVIWLGIFSPVWIVIIIIIYLVRRRRQGVKTTG